MDAACEAIRSTFYGGSKPSAMAECELGESGDCHRPKKTIELVGCRATGSRFTRDSTSRRDYEQGSLLEAARDF
jgi:hypothetical protein